MENPTSVEAARAARSLRAHLADLTGDGPTSISQSQVRAVRAVNTACGALETDPTLAARDRELRKLDLLGELLRQLKPLSRQAENELERRRLAALPVTPDTQRATSRLGRTNPHALGELEALSRRAVEIADAFAAEALPDWNTPRRIRERSESLLPGPDDLAEVADQLRRLIAPSLTLPYPAADAVRLAALADRIATAMDDPDRPCAGPGCERTVTIAANGRPRLYCGPACRQRANRARSHSPS